jgi:hypothetical protein
MKTIVVLSSLVDRTISDELRGTNFILFRRLEELGEYVDRTPIRAETMFVTRETVSLTNTALGYLVSLLGSPFFKVDRIVYITERNAPELPSVRYIIEEKNLANWTVEESNLTREQVSGIITGTARKSDEDYHRKAVFRVPRSAYVNDQIRSRGSLSEHYVSDDEYLSEIPDVQVPPEIPPERPAVCRTVHVGGLPGAERTAFAFVFAQYLSLSGKTLIAEKDVEYHTLSDFAIKSGVKALCVPVEELLAEPRETLNKIRRTDEKLVCVTARARIRYSYEFLCGLLYNNLADALDRFVIENDISELPSTEPSVLVLPTRLPELLRTCESLQMAELPPLKFVGVDLGFLPETRARDGQTIGTILADVLELKEIPDVTTAGIRSLKLGGDYALFGIFD